MRLLWVCKVEWLSLGTVCFPRSFRRCPAACPGGCFSCWWPFAWELGSGARHYTWTRRKDKPSIWSSPPWQLARANVSSSRLQPWLAIRGEWAVAERRSEHCHIMDAGKATKSKLSKPNMQKLQPVCVRDEVFYTDLTSGRERDFTD